MRDYQYTQSCVECGKDLYVEPDFDGYVICSKCEVKSKI